jgi:hypothetical protein
MANNPSKFTSLFGGDFYLAQDDVRGYFREPLVMLFLALCALIIVVYRSGEHYTLVEEIVSPNLLMAVEFLTALAVLTFLNLLFFFNAFLQARGIITTVFVPLVTIPTACFIQAATAVAVWSITSEWPEHAIGFEELSQDVIVLLAMEAMFVLYVVPISDTFTRKHLGDASQQDVQDSSTTAMGHPLDASPAEPQFVPPANADLATDVAGQLGNQSRVLSESPTPDVQINLPTFVHSNLSLSVQEFEYVRSKGHYLHFIQGETEKNVRGNMRMVHDQFGTSHGIQINRSVWVSFQAVDQIIDDGGKCVVRLKSGHKENVTSARKLAVTMAYSDFKSGQ